jgi:hypothetical protein
MDVSIIVPFLDAAATLPACLAGLQARDDFDGGDRLVVFRKTVHNKSYGFLRASTLAVLLAVGLWAWAIGRVSGYVIRK